MQFVRVMSTPAGRGARVVVGLGLIALGAKVGGVAGCGLAGFGLLPLVTGAADICPVCPLLPEGRRGEAGCRGATCS